MAEVVFLPFKGESCRINGAKAMIFHQGSLKVWPFFCVDFTKPKQFCGNLAQ